MIRDGHFCGALIRTELTSSFGMSVYRNNEFGLLFTDGSRAGGTEEHYSHSSTEVSESRHTVYSLKKRD